VTVILRGPHAVKGDSRTPFAQHDCESCHGPSEAHAAGHGRNRPPPTVVFVGPNASPVEERNKMCLSCHEAGLRLHWAGSQHQANDVACTNCHNPHTEKDPVLVRTSQPQVCFTCHTEQRAETLEFSHHPIREGKVICSDCHNPHGSVGPKMVKENTINETCYNCHAEKRGPLLFEHEPVREECTNCHTPHGSVIARLLKERLPYLCENCHGGSGGHNGAPFAGQNLPGGNNTLASSGLLNNPQLQINARGCLNCHSQIHGSNSPGGLYFTR
jgi:DmsE family decaheme c-type cytochrome